MDMDVAIKHCTKRIGIWDWSSTDESVEPDLDRFSIAMDAIDRVPELKVAGAHAKERFRNEQIACCHYAYEHGIDKPEMVNWKWPY
jgi:xylulose-5-phosphate/fructose-6-phosphate phosphoketolase